MLTEAGRKLHESRHTLDWTGRCSERFGGSTPCELERAIADIEAQAIERRLIVASEERAALELLPAALHTAAVMGRIQYGWVGPSDMLEEWASVIRQALATDLVMDQARLTRAIDTVSAHLEAQHDPLSSIYADPNHPALAALLLAAAREEEGGVRALYARLAKEYEAEPIVPDRGGGLPEDRYSL